MSQTAGKSQTVGKRVPEIPESWTVRAVCLFLGTIASLPALSQLYSLLSPNLANELIGPKFVPECPEAGINLPRKAILISPCS